MKTITLEELKEFRNDTAKLANWTVKHSWGAGFSFYKNDKYIEGCIMRPNDAVEFAKKNCFTEKSEAEELAEIFDKFFETTGATRDRFRDLVIPHIVQTSGGDSIRDAGISTRVEFEPVTWDFLQKWSKENGVEMDKLQKAIHF